MTNQILTGLAPQRVQPRWTGVLRQGAVRDAKDSVGGGCVHVRGYLNKNSYTVAPHAMRNHVAGAQGLQVAGSIQAAVLRGDVKARRGALRARGSAVTAGLQKTTRA